VIVCTQPALPRLLYYIGEQLRYELNLRLVMIKNGTVLVECSMLPTEGQASLAQIDSRECSEWDGPPRPVCSHLR
jgi:hypothetical protein